MIEESEAKIVRFIYDAYIRNTPLYLIKEQARELGFPRRGNTAIERILEQPAYAGLLRVEAYKEHKGGLFNGIHEPIIDPMLWKLVQEKIKRPDKSRTVIDDEIPLRGIVKCHCGNPLSGAPSRGKGGKYYYYYKCKHSRHNNISAIKAHNQFLEICDMMSLPLAYVKKIKKESRENIDKEFQNNRKVVIEKKKQLQEVEEKLFSVEEKWIGNDINRETYDRWYSVYNNEIISLKGSIERLGDNKQSQYLDNILDKRLELLTDMRYIYTKADTLQKREFVNMVFDSNLYYENGIYRTPTMLDILSVNHLKMRDKGFLFYEKKAGLFNKVPLSGLVG